MKWTERDGDVERSGETFLRQPACFTDATLWVKVVNRVNSVEVMDGMISLSVVGNQSGFHVFILSANYSGMGFTSWYAHILLPA